MTEQRGDIERLHPFDGRLDQPCLECGQPYETEDERHEYYGKVWFFDEDGKVQTAPYTMDHYRRETGLAPEGHWHG